MGDMYLRVVHGYSITILDKYLDNLRLLNTYSSTNKSHPYPQVGNSWAKQRNRQEKLNDEFSMPNDLAGWKLCNRLTIYSILSWNPAVRYLTFKCILSFKAKRVTNVRMWYNF